MACWQRLRVDLWRNRLLIHRPTRRAATERFARAVLASFGCRVFFEVFRLLNKFFSFVLNHFYTEFPFVMLLCSGFMLSHIRILVVYTLSHNCIFRLVLNWLLYPFYDFLFIYIYFFFEAYVSEKFIAYLHELTKAISCQCLDSESFCRNTVYTIGNKCTFIIGKGTIIIIF